MSLDHNVYIVNDTDEEIYVLVTPNKDYALTDLFIGCAMTLASLGSLSLKLMTTITTVNDLALVITTLDFIGSGIDVTLKLHEFLEKHSVKIPRLSYKLVNNKSTLNPLQYIGTSGWGSIFDGSDMTLLITNKKLTKSALFNTNSDYSWIVSNNEIVRSKYGSIWEVDRAEGFHRFSKGDRLKAGEYLAPQESLSSKNKNFDFVYQKDGNAVVYGRMGDPKLNSVIWESHTNGTFAFKFHLQNDANIVIYSSENNPVAASGTKFTRNEGGYLVMENEGYLVAYDKYNQVFWDTKNKDFKFDRVDSPKSTHWLKNSDGIA